jgi:sugar-specific transcriptional regulator TrmB
LTAKEVINTFPNRGENVYRPLDRLVELGIAEKTEDWPKRYVTNNLKISRRGKMLTFPYANNHTNILEKISEALNRILRRIRKNSKSS